MSLSNENRRRLVEHAERQQQEREARDAEARAQLGHRSTTLPRLRPTSDNVTGQENDLAN